tara:strand:- start:105 stop:371 length:267 start_codon:yes stop_codon:yes gene_type:complete
MTPSNTIKRLEMYIKYWDKSVNVQKSLNRLKQQCTEVSQVIELGQIQQMVLDMDKVITDLHDIDKTDAEELDRYINQQADLFKEENNG